MRPYFIPKYKHICSIMVSLAITVAHVSYAERWVQEAGKGYIICDELLKQLNAYPYPKGQHSDSCLFNIIQNHKDFKDVPWEPSIKAKDHQELLLNLLKQDRYFKDGIPTSNDIGSYKAHRQLVDNMVKENIQFRLWKVPYPAEQFWYFNDESPAALKDPINVINATSPNTDSSDDYCTVKDQKRKPEKMTQILVNNDFTAPDLRLNPKLNTRYSSIPEIRLYTLPVYLYKGTPYFFLDRSSVIYIMRPDINTFEPDNEFCRLKIKR